MKRWTAAACFAAIVHLSTLAQFNAAKVVIDREVVAAVGQIQVALRSLLKSIEEDGRESANLFGKRQEWCASSMLALNSTTRAVAQNLTHLRLEAQDEAAVAEEADLAAKQLRADEALVRHTKNQTQLLLSDGVVGSLQGGNQSLQNLLRFHVRNADSLQKTLEVESPALTSLKTRVSETEQRVTEGTETLAGVTAFSALLARGCGKSLERGQSEAFERVDEASSIEDALQSLEFLKSRDESDKHDPNFIQLRSTARSPVRSAANLPVLAAIDIIGDGTSDVSQRALSQHHATVAADVDVERLVASAQEQLATGQHSQAGNGDHQWCAEEGARASSALQVAQDALNNAVSDMARHAAAEAALGVALATVASGAALVKNVSRQAAQDWLQEQSLAGTVGKNRVVAGQILTRAGTLLVQMQSARAFPNDEATEKTISGVVAALSAAKSKIAQHMQKAADHALVAKEFSTQMVQTSGDATEAFSRERAMLESIRNEHAEQHVQLAEGRPSLEMEKTAAASYLQQLENECADAAKSATAEQNARETERRALQDAQSAMVGAPVYRTRARHREGSHLLRGADVARRSLTPIEEAAAQMGVDDNI